jgi:hypothetical protein
MFISPPNFRRKYMFWLTTLYLNLFKSQRTREREAKEREEADRARIMEAAVAIIEEEKRVAKEAEIAEGKRIEELKQAAIRLDEEKQQQLKNSNEPWVKLESIEMDINGNIAMKLDWNSAFIKYLRDNCNFQGDDDRIVQQYIGAMWREMYDDRNNEALDLLKQPEYAEDSVNNKKDKLN